jgi:hypothetical protein
VRGRVGGWTFVRASSYQKDDELRRFGVARVAADDVNVIRTFIKSFTGFKRYGLGASQLYHDRTLDT